MNPHPHPAPPATPALEFSMRVPPPPEGALARLIWGGDPPMSHDEALLVVTDPASAPVEGLAAYLLVFDQPGLESLIVGGILHREMWTPDSLFLSIRCDPQDHDFASWVKVVTVLGGREVK